MLFITLKLRALVANFYTIAYFLLLDHSNSIVTSCWVLHASKGNQESSHTVPHILVQQISTHAAFIVPPTSLLSQFLPKGNCISKLVINQIQLISTLN